MQNDSLTPDQSDVNNAAAQDEHLPDRWYKRSDERYEFISKFRKIGLVTILSITVAPIALILLCTGTVYFRSRKSGFVYEWTASMRVLWALFIVSIILITIRIIAMIA
ncbi:hypothetical protein Mycsm_01757 [Mycobacterium sp. JS623]|uniref:hypothetical protein n=1 Tax=Mycobacterium sp. JS623 TaxID=212767 RepID=UPI0002A5AE44|nr:hypothetical protein [Mycobacterium sp. JS623]AGB22150.1 hypothetical protein Mycsm_01757 [Mycobacterium sp. JS623]